MNVITELSRTMRMHHRTFTPPKPVLTKTQKCIALWHKQSKGVPG